MGQVIGINGVKEPAFSLVWTGAPYEVRRYHSYFVAQVPCTENNNNAAFTQLASYIGVFGTPKNSKSQAIAMTAPVVTKPEAIAMTAPVVTDGQFMQFVLPEDFKSREEVPTPLNTDIQILQVPARYVAVSKFSGSYSQAYFMQQYQDLLTRMQQEGFISADATRDSGIKWSFAQYNPPYTIPFYRRNEVWIEMQGEYTTEKFKEMAEGKEVSREM
uniref:SOUL heme-binding protein n=1 Tax=Arcella intermedia TaxID=1963864 RepID=A0A6B2LIF2_9EUKA|eukprot:TRINITY_DN9386_c0_g1_i1.p1 TRINITY_DN9386_c0_g1~~TRINITY_DN9386_c0_g1_i1.p1  ORF type:complete len:216 (-),score=28.61 TRINITY_DN9386_c0_g1_i1:49-696(-)